MDTSTLLKSTESLPNDESACSFGSDNYVPNFLESPELESIENKQLQNFNIIKIREEQENLVENIVFPPVEGIIECGDESRHENPQQSHLIRKKREQEIVDKNLVFSDFKKSGYNDCLENKNSQQSYLISIQEEKLESESITRDSFKLPPQGHMEYKQIPDEIKCENIGLFIECNHIDLSKESSSETSFNKIKLSNQRQDTKESFVCEFNQVNNIENNVDLREIRKENYISQPESIITKAAQNINNDNSKDHSYIGVNGPINSRNDSYENVDNRINVNLFNQIPLYNQEINYFHQNADQPNGHYAIQNADQKMQQTSNFRPLYHPYHIPTTMPGYISSNPPQNQISQPHLPSVQNGNMIICQPHPHPIYVHNQPRIGFPNFLVTNRPSIPANASIYNSFPRYPLIQQLPRINAQNNVALQAPQIPQQNGACFFIQPQYQ